MLTDQRQHEPKPEAVPATHTQPEQEAIADKGKLWQKLFGRGKP